MGYFDRRLAALIKQLLEAKQSILLLGARQTGKTTLIKQFSWDLSINLIETDVRYTYEATPSRLSAEIDALAEKLAHPPKVFIDEIQKVPLLLDEIQSLIDRGRAQFILTGSSARKLRHQQQVNLLPGRLIQLQLDALSIFEVPISEHKTIEYYLNYGSLPGILTTSEIIVRDLLLKTYVSTYLEEEIRQEAAVRQLGSFVRFLQLSAQEAGYLINLQKLSQDIGVSSTTISRYFQLLEDCLIAEQVQPLAIENSRRQLVKAPKLLYFDLGVRRLAAQEGLATSPMQLGHLFEQWVGMEIKKLTRNMTNHHQLNYWRDRNGIEVDWILTLESTYIPIEVKWTSQPNAADIKHLQIFLKEHPQVEKAYVICRVTRAMKLSDKIYALPWQELPNVINTE